MNENLLNKIEQLDKWKFMMLILEDVQNKEYAQSMAIKGTIIRTKADLATVIRYIEKRKENEFEKTPYYDKIVKEVEDSYQCILSHEEVKSLLPETIDSLLHSGQFKPDDYFRSVTQENINDALANLRNNPSNFREIAGSLREMYHYLPYSHPLYNQLGDLVTKDIYSLHTMYQEEKREQIMMDSNKSWQEKLATRSEAFMSKISTLLSSRMEKAQTRMENAQKNDEAFCDVSKDSIHNEMVGTIESTRDEKVRDEYQGILGLYDSLEFLEKYENASLREKVGVISNKAVIIANKGYLAMLKCIDKIINKDENIR